MKRFNFSYIILAVAFILAACAAPVETIIEKSEAILEEGLEGDIGRGPLVLEDGKLYLAIIWHQHQPVYFKEPDSNLYQRPWVRLHASKDYLDMAEILKDYPDIHATFNLTPSLIRQLDDISAGAKDIYWAYTEKPADELSAEDKEFILARFFDTNRGVIARFPRYQDLLDDQANFASWTAEDFRDLQVLFNLAWTDPDWLAEDPFKSLVEKREGYSEEDKKVILDEHLRMVKEVIPLHAEMQNSGQIEVTMTPFAHPILPLLVDSNLAAVALPDAELPTRFVYGQDAVAQTKKGVEFYRDHFGSDPRGMWPAEGSVAEEIVSMISSAGIEWIASDEDVLEGSLPEIKDFTRDNADIVQQADALYRPYSVKGVRGDPVAIIFRDKTISDLVGFQYSGTNGVEAAADLLTRLRNIKNRLEEEGGQGPHLVTVLLDGENAWEYYDNDGKLFLNEMYKQLSEADDIVTVTPSEYLDALADQGTELREIDQLWQGSWIDGTFSTWIGEEEENLAWEYLKQTRDDLQDAIVEGKHDQETLDEALEIMYIAEGSDWFWWYGSDQNSGNDESFDQQYRNYLKQIYTLLGQEPPALVSVPIIPQAAVAPDQEPAEMLSRIIPDGQNSLSEWQGAGHYLVDEVGIQAVYFGFDEEHLYLRFDLADDYDRTRTYGIYLNVPGAKKANAFTRYGEGDTLLGFGVNRLLELTYQNGNPNVQIFAADGQEGWIGPENEEPTTIGGVGESEQVLEIVLPFSQLAPGVRSGDRLNIRLVVSQAEEDIGVFPLEGPAMFVVPDLPIPNVFLDVDDPTSDDFGPGTYSYPKDIVFKAGAYDISGFIAGMDEDYYIFRVMIRGPVENSWGSPNGLSIQTVDIYIDTDQGETGDRILLPGRNAALMEGSAWNYAVWAEGWTSGIFEPDVEGPVELGAEPVIITNPGQRRVTINVPRRLLPDSDPNSWAFAVALMSQEGYPAAGVWRVRDVLEEGEQWRIGGGTNSNLDTRIMDILWPEENEGDQMNFLTNPFPGEEVILDELSLDYYPQIPMVSP